MSILHELNTTVSEEIFSGHIYDLHMITKRAFGSSRNTLKDSVDEKSLTNP